MNLFTKHVTHIETVDMKLKCLRCGQEKEIPITQYFTKKAEDIQAAFTEQHSECKENGNG